MGYLSSPTISSSLEPAVRNLHDESPFALISLFLVFLCFFFLCERSHSFFCVSPPRGEPGKFSFFFLSTAIRSLSSGCASQLASPLLPPLFRARLSSFRMKPSLHQGETGFAGAPVDWTPLRRTAEFSSRSCKPPVLFFSPMQPTTPTFSQGRTPQGPGRARPVVPAKGSPPTLL